MSKNKLFLRYDIKAVQMYVIIDADLQENEYPRFFLKKVTLHKWRQRLVTSLF